MAPISAATRAAPAPAYDPALDAYESLAPFYDRFTAGYEHERWLDGLEAWALERGLAGRRLLDVGCGTGKSFEPMLRKGYEVTGCDLSPAMVAEARAKCAGAATVTVADMRALPWRSRFDLVTCLDDAVNYLLTEDDLLMALAGMRRSLRPGGILLFDTNTLGTYRTTFADDFEVAEGSTTFRWRAEGDATAEPGAVSSATIEMIGPEGVLVSRHVQRHWPVDALRDACREAGLRGVSFRGQVPGGLIVDEPDEEAHTKVLCLAARPDFK